MFSSVGLLNISSNFSKAWAWQKSKLALPSIFPLIFKSKCIKGNLIHMLMIHLHLTHQKYCFVRATWPSTRLGSWWHTDRHSRIAGAHTQALILYIGVIFFTLNTRLNGCLSKSWLHNYTYPCNSMRKSQCNYESCVASQSIQN